MASGLRGCWHGRSSFEEALLEASLTAGRSGVTTLAIVSVESSLEDQLTLKMGPETIPFQSHTKAIRTRRALKGPVVFQVRVQVAA